MAQEKPDHHDAELVLKLYELRRETVMRASRKALNAQFWPKSYDDLKAISQFDHPLNTAWRQVSSYWELVYSLARHGIVNAGFLIENNGEGLFLYAKIKPFVEQYRKDFAPTAFRNAEWICTECEEGRKRFEGISGHVARVAQLIAAAKASKGKKGKKAK